MEGPSRVRTLVLRDGGDEGRGRRGRWGGLDAKSAKSYSCRVETGDVLQGPPVSGPWRGGGGAEEPGRGLTASNLQPLQ